MTILKIIYYVSNSKIINKIFHLSGDPNLLKSPSLLVIDNWFCGQKLSNFQSFCQGTFILTAFNISDIVIDKLPFISLSIKFARTNLIVW